MTVYIHNSSALGNTRERQTWSQRQRLSLEVELEVLEYFQALIWASKKASRRLPGLIKKESIITVPSKTLIVYRYMAKSTKIEHILMFACSNQDCI